MKKFQFTASVKVAGVKYAAGDLVTEADIPVGYFESCVRVGHLVEVPAAPDPAETFAAAMEAGPPVAEQAAFAATDVPTPTSPAEPPALTVGPPPGPEPEPRAEPKHDTRDKRKK